MHERLKKLRRILDLTQQEFAERIGSKRNTVAKYETATNTPSAAVVSLICREFNVREEWLRTGKGEIFRPKPSDILDQLAYKYQFSNADYVIAEKFVSLSPNKRKEMIENVFGILHEIESALADVEPYAPAYAESKTPYPMDDSIAKDQHHMTVEEAEAIYKKSILNSVPTEESTASNSTEEGGSNAVNL